MHRAVVDCYIPESLDVTSMAELIISPADMKVCAFFHHLQPNKRSDCGLIPGAAARGAAGGLGLRPLPTLGGYRSGPRAAQPVRYLAATVLRCCLD